MQITLQQLAPQLKKSLAAIYLISGDVPLLVQEATEQIRNIAKQKDFTDHRVLHVDSQFSWQDFLADTQNLSLFNNKEIIELRLVNNLSANGAESLIQYCKQPSTDKIIILRSNKLDSKQQKSAWVQNIIKQGIFLPIWPMEFHEYVEWIKARINKAGLALNEESLQLLANFTEGNLLAAQQEIEKLRLLFADQTQISTQEITQAITDNARFDSFQLVDATLQGDPNRITHILQNLRQEGVEPILIAWALTKEIRQLATLAELVQQNIPLAKAFQMQFVWEKRKPLFARTLKQHTLHSLQKLLQHAAKIDRQIKGMQTGNVWDELLKMCLNMAGVKACLN